MGSVEVFRAIFGRLLAQCFQHFEETVHSPVGSRATNTWPEEFGQKKEATEGLFLICCLACASGTSTVAKWLFLEEVLSDAFQSHHARKHRLAPQPSQSCK